MVGHRIFATPFAKVYPLYVQKATRKNRTKEEVDKVICWLTGYGQAELQKQIDQGSDFEAFFAEGRGCWSRRDPYTPPVRSGESGVISRWRRCAIPYLKEVAA